MTVSTSRQISLSLHLVIRFSKGGRIRLYRHFAFRVAPEPPFNITAVSDELPLVFNPSFQVGAGAWE